MTRSFSVVGTGRLGTALAAALARRGWRPAALVDRDLRAAREARRLTGAGRASTALGPAPDPGRLVVVAVPDAEVAKAAAALARSGVDWTGRVVVHTSGLLAASALAPLARRGALTASCHPVQSFARKDAPASVFAGVTWGVEGDPEAVEACGRVVRSLRGHVLLLAAKDKPLYHAACALASNAFVALEGTAVDLLGRAGIDRGTAEAVLLPLVEGTLQNVKKLGVEKALTGPVIRGDQSTVAAHLEALRKDPRAADIYRALGKAVLEMAARRGLAPARVRSLRRRLGGG